MNILHLRDNRQRGLHWSKPQAGPIETLPVPDTLYIPISHWQQTTAELLVTTGSTLYKGQPLTRSYNHNVIITHASSSGEVIDISDNRIAIKTDGRDEVSDELIKTTGSLSRQEITDIAHRNGLTGQGGAGFPLARKIASLPQQPQLLLVNAAECDPDIHCDDALIQAYAPLVVESVLTIAEACEIDRVVIGIENDKTRSIEQLQQAMARQTNQQKIELVTIPSQYPSGAENILLQLCTSEQAGPHESLASAGILSMNIATCYAMGQAVFNGMPPISRITTVVTPDGRHRNFKLLTGTPVNHILDYVNYERPIASIEQEVPLHVTQGGRMMSEALDTQAVITQQSNCITISNTKGVQSSVPCIRCGACSDICPVRLMPQHLHKAATHFDAVQLDNLNVDRCIECRCCDVVCPSAIPLTAQFIQAKEHKHRQNNEQIAADLAKQRYDKRQRRLQKEQSGKRRTRLKEKAAPATPQSRKDLIAQALKRSAKKKPNDTADNGSSH